MARLADYLTVNISSPNTPGLRALQDKGALDALLQAVIAERGEGGPPIFLKVAPDLEPQDVEDVAAVALDRKIDALIVSNTTISRPALQSRHRGESGGLSGLPLRDLALERLRDFRRATGGAMPLIAAGGIASGTDAWARIRAGASLVQLYSALVYQGPGLAKRIAGELKPLMLKQGFSRLADAVGADERAGTSRLSGRSAARRRRRGQDHAFAPGIGAALEPAVAQEDAVEAAILALPAAQLDAAGTQPLDHGRREAGHLAAIIGARAR
jgi:dihydroorotate dehydrogenase subfamily 2